MLFTYEGNIILSRLNELLKTYFMATGISIMAIDTQGNTLLSYGDSFDFCQILNDNTENACNCQDSHLQACKYAINVGEAYFFFCPHEFVNIAVPLVHQEKFLGGLLVGPLIVKTNTADFDSENFIKKRFPNLSKEKLAEIQDIFQQIPITDPIRTNYLGNMLYMMASQEMESYQQFMSEKRHKMQQQSKINEQIQMYKNITKNNTHFHDLEMQLFAKVKSGNLEEALTILNQWQALIYYAEADNIDIIKARAMELCSLLSRAAIEGGADSKKCLACNYSFLDPLNNLNSREDVSFWLENILEYYTDSVLELSPIQSVDTIRKAIAFMNQNFTEQITIKEVADHIHMNPTYFSSIFKKATKKPFSQYLQQIRVEESKLLLTTTQQSILSVAISCGFSSQSYFTKVFIKNTGITPKEYRLQNAVIPIFQDNK